VNSINCFNKNKNKKKLNKCQSVFSDDRRIKRYDRGHLSGSYSHMVIDVKREEFFKSLRDFNVRMKNISKINHMKSIQQQQKKVFMERLRDLVHYLKFLDKYCKELKEFSKRENEDTEVIKEMQKFTKNKFKLLRNYIKGNKRSYK